MPGLPSSFEQRERRFALALLAPALLLLLLITTAPLVYLLWASVQRLDMSMPWMSGFAGLGNYAKMGGDPRFWNSLLLTVVYTGSTVVLQVLVGLALALLVLQIPKGQAAFRVADGVRHRPAFRHIAGIFQGSAKLGAGVFVIGDGEAGAGAGDRFAVGFQQGGIHPVQRGAAHQADDFQDF